MTVRWRAPVPYRVGRRLGHPAAPVASTDSGEITVDDRGLTIRPLEIRAEA